MNSLLHVAASPRLQGSHSRQAAERIIQRMRARCPALQVRERDLGRTPIAHPDAAFVLASLTPAPLRDDADRAALALSEKLIQELERASALLISTPMHNFTLPSVLKTWIDHIVRPGRSFALSPQGKIGLLVDRPVFVVMACGGDIASNQSGGQPDWLRPYLRSVLAVVGLTQLEFITLDHRNRTTADIAGANARFDTWLSRLEWP